MVITILQLTIASTILHNKPVVLSQKNMMRKIKTKMNFAKKYSVGKFINTIYEWTIL